MLLQSAEQTSLLLIREASDSSGARRGEAQLSGGRFFAVHKPFPQGELIRMLRL